MREEDEKGEEEDKRGRGEGMGRQERREEGLERQVGMRDKRS